MSWKNPCRDKTASNNGMQVPFSSNSPLGSPIMAWNSRSSMSEMALFPTIALIAAEPQDCSSWLTLHPSASSKWRSQQSPTKNDKGNNTELTQATGALLQHVLQTLMNVLQSLMNLLRRVVNLLRRFINGSQRVINSLLDPTACLKCAKTHDVTSIAYDGPPHWIQNDTESNRAESGCLRYRGMTALLKPIIISVS